MRDDMQPRESNGGAEAQPADKAPRRPRAPKDRPRRLPRWRAWRDRRNSVRPRSLPSHAKIAAAGACPAAPRAAPWPWIPRAGRCEVAAPPLKKTRYRRRERTSPWQKSGPRPFLRGMEAIAGRPLGQPARYRHLWSTFRRQSIHSTMTRSKPCRCKTNSMR